MLNGGCGYERVALTLTSSQLGLRSFQDELSAETNISTAMRGYQGICPGLIRLGIMKYWTSLEDEVVLQMDHPK